MSSAGDDIANAHGLPADGTDPLAATGQKKATRQSDPLETPRLTPAAEAARQKRLAAEAEALRANLRRRKAQARARSEAETASPSPDSSSHDDAPNPFHNRPETS